MPMPFDEAAQVLARARQVARWATLRLRRQLTWEDVEWQDLKDAEDEFDVAWRRAQALRPKPTGTA